MTILKQKQKRELNLPYGSKINNNSLISDTGEVSSPVVYLCASRLLTCGRNTVMSKHYFTSIHCKIT